MTTQSRMWGGKFGDDYHARQRANHKGREQYLADVVPPRASGIRTRVLELGCGRGDNLRVFKKWGWPAAGIEINPEAARVARKRYGNVWCGDITGWPTDLYLRSFVDNWEPDIILTRGCLIHIDPRNLPPVYQMIRDSTASEAVLGEYHAPVATPVRYQGKEGMMWRGDFAAPLIDTGWVLIYAAFHSRHGPARQDDITTLVVSR